MTFQAPPPALPSAHVISSDAEAVATAKPQSRGHHRASSRGTIADAAITVVPR